uniref:Coiled-coil domain-containing protein 39 n=1 Tax=Nothobranchius furzeri TaxID=105023 RepID=A0A8C6LJ07_NOTFU
MFKTEHKLEEFKLQMDWDQQILDAFLEESARKDEDMMSIVKYAQQEEHRIKSLTVTIEKKALEASEKYKALEKQLIETTTAQVKTKSCVTSDLFTGRIKHVEQLITQWANSVEQIKHQDSEMQRCALVMGRALKVVLNRTTSEVEALMAQISRTKKDLHQNNEKSKLKAATRTTVSKEERAAQVEQFLKEKEQGIKELDSQLHVLTGALSHHRQQLQLLKTKEKEFTMQITRSKSTISSLECQHLKLEKEVIRQQMITTLQVQTLQILIIPSQEEMVERKMVMMEVKRVKDLLYSKADTMLSLEKRKSEREKALKIKKEEIKVLIKTLSQQLKVTEQEKQKLQAEFSEKLTRIERLKSRFEVMVLSMGALEGEEEKTQAFYIVKAAQDKEELRQKGDELEAKVHKMALETKALENTILMFNDLLSSSYHRSFSKVKESSLTYQEKVKLEEQLRSNKERLEQKQQQVQELQQDMQVSSKKHNFTFRHLVTESLHVFCYVQSSKLTKLICSAKDTKAETLELQDIKLKELKEFNKNINEMLHKVMKDNDDLRSVLEKSLLQLGGAVNWNYKLSLLCRSPVSSARRNTKSLALSSAQLNTISLDWDPAASPSPPASSRSFTSTKSNRKSKF